MTQMQKINVKTASRHCDTFVGDDLLPKVGLLLREKGYSRRAVIVTDSNVKVLYAGTLGQSLENAGFGTSVLEIPSGEEQKTLETAGRLYLELVRLDAERTTPVVALGGGVIGDLAGFVAATYMRGVPLVQVPTSLLAMVDSSIGGKTAVDHGGLKNIVGSFYQPELVIADTGTLKTLPKNELASGMAEVIKHAAIRSASLFQLLEVDIHKAMTGDTGVLETIIAENVKIKAEVVSQDERDTGLRAILNFGHTVGHAIETVSGFKLKHGEAVAVGMVAAAEISCRLGYLSGDDTARLEDLIKKAGLPVAVPALDKNSVMKAMGHDKKVRHGRMRFVLLKAIGEAFIAEDIDPMLVEEVVFGRD